MSAKITLCLLIIFYSALYPQERTSIAFQDLEQLLSEHSPAVGIIMAEQELARARARGELAWSNPEIGADIEKVSAGEMSEKEMVIAMGKFVSAPWTRLLQKSALKFKMNATQNEKEERIRQALAGARLLYARIQLSRQHVERMHGFQDVISRASQIARDRKEAGVMSGLQEQLIHMSMFNLNASLLQLERETQRQESAFKAGLGILSAEKVKMTTALDYIPIRLQQPQVYIDQLDATLKTRQLTDLAYAAAKQTALAKANVLPGFQVSGGYKQVDDELNGYVLGLAIPLPLFNFNRAQVQQSRIEQRIIDLQLQEYIAAATADIHAATTALDDLSTFLEQNFQQFRATEQVVEDLVFSYQEGWIELGDVLDGIQLYSESLSNYYQQLYAYYENIFALEALLGFELLTLY